MLKQTIPKKHTNAKSCVLLNLFCFPYQAFCNHCVINDCLERNLTCIREASGLDDFALVAPRLANGCDVTTWCAEALGMHPIQLHVGAWMSFCSQSHAHKTYGGICTCAHAHGCKVGYPLRSMGRLGIKARAQAS